MQTTVKSYFKKFTILAAVSGGIAAVIIAFASLQKLLIFLGAYLISFALTASNFYVIGKINIQDFKRFFKIFGYTLGLRFMGAIIAVILGIKVLNYHQIFFTVSFIFSYICHSVIEIIFLNKMLKTDT